MTCVLISVCELDSSATWIPDIIATVHYHIEHNTLHICINLYSMLSVHMRHCAEAVHDKQSQPSPLVTEEIVQPQVQLDTVVAASADTDSLAMEVSVNYSFWKWSVSVIVEVGMYWPAGLVTVKYNSFRQQGHVATTTTTAVSQTFMCTQVCYYLYPVVLVTRQVINSVHIDIRHDCWISVCMCVSMSGLNVSSA